MQLSAFNANRIHIAHDLIRGLVCVSIAPWTQATHGLPSWHGGRAYTHWMTEHNMQPPMPFYNFTIHWYDAHCIKVYGVAMQPTAGLWLWAMAFCAYAASISNYTFIVRSPNSLTFWQCQYGLLANCCWLFIDNVCVRSMHGTLLNLIWLEEPQQAVRNERILQTHNAVLYSTICIINRCLCLNECYQALLFLEVLVINSLICGGYQSNWMNSSSWSVYHLPYQTLHNFKLIKIQIECNPFIKDMKWKWWMKTIFLAVAKWHGSACTVLCVMTSHYDDRTHSFEQEKKTVWSAFAFGWARRDEIKKYYKSQWASGWQRRE